MTWTKGPTTWRKGAGARREGTETGEKEPRHGQKEPRHGQKEPRHGHKEPRHGHKDRLQYTYDAAHEEKNVHLGKRKNIKNKPHHASLKKNFDHIEMYVPTLKVILHKQYVIHYQRLQL